MNATILSLLLGGGAALTAVYTFLTQMRDRKRSIVRQKGAILLDEETRLKIAAEAAQIDADKRIKIEKWWKEQFDAVREELTIEQKQRRRLTRWANEHQEWDRRAWALAMLADPAYPAPPLLDQDP